LPEARCRLHALDCLLAIDVAELMRARRRMHRQTKRLSVLRKCPPVPDTQMRPADHPHRATAEMTDDGITVVDELAERRVVRGPVRQHAHRSRLDSSNAPPLRHAACSTAPRPDQTVARQWRTSFRAVTSLREPIQRRASVISGPGASAPREHRPGEDNCPLRSSKLGSSSGLSLVRTLVPAGTLCATGRRGVRGSAVRVRVPVTARALASTSTSASSATASLSDRPASRRAAPASEPPTRKRSSTAATRAASSRRSDGSTGALAPPPDRV
jgi:hypothetical protein